MVLGNVGWIAAKPLFAQPYGYYPTRRVNWVKLDVIVVSDMQHVAIQKPCLQFLRNVIFPNGRAKLGQRLSQIRLQQSQLWRHTNSQVHCRGAKSKATIQLKELPQGVLETNNSVRVREQDGPAYPMMIQQARNNMRKFADCVLLTRVGGFYEVQVATPIFQDCAYVYVALF